MWAKRTINYAICFLFHKYNRVEARNLPPTKVESCVLLPHIMFEVLSNHLEKTTVIEDNFRYVSDEELLEESSYTQQDYLWLCKETTTHIIELCELYNWWYDEYIPWNNNRKEYYRSRGCGLVPGQYASEESVEIDSEMRRDLKKNMSRLVHLHENLWS